jgi:co-chaperonin GroES (HSP10)
MKKETLSTSEKEVPKINLGLEEKYKEEAKNEKTKEPLNPENIKSVVDELPTPGYVLKIGPLAYHDKEKYPTGPWCKKGDWVIFARYAGSRLPIEGGEVRILNDDEVLGTIPDPESVLHYI